MEFSELLKSPTFWFTTVIMGIIVGILSNVLHNLLQKLLAKFSEKQKLNNKEKEEKFQLAVKKLVENPAKATELKIEAIYALISSIAKLVLYLMLMNLVSATPFSYSIINSILYLIIAIFAVSVGISMFIKDNYTGALLKEYNQQYKITHLE